MKNISLVGIQSQSYSSADLKRLYSHPNFSRPGEARRMKTGAVLMELMKGDVKAKSLLIFLSLLFAAGMTTVLWYLTG
jgi:hypothetical protein